MDVVARQRRGDALWLAGVCLSRFLLALIFTSYAAVLPVLQREWNMSAAAAGSVASAFQLGYAISLVGWNILADRIGARPVFLWSSLAGAPAAMAFALFADSPLSAALLYGLTALMIGGNYTPGLILLAERFPAATRGRATGFFLAATSMGYAGSLFLTAAVLPRWGWRASLVASSLGPVVAAVIAAWAVWDMPTRIYPRAAGHGFVVGVLRNPGAMLLMAAYTFHSWELLGMWAWTPAFLSAALVHQGLDLGRATGGGAWRTALFHLTGFTASLSAGYLSDRFGRTTVIIAMLLVSTTCSLLFGWLVAAPFWILLLVGLVYGFSAVGDSPVLSVGLTEIVAPHVLGSALALRSLLGFGAGAIAQWAFGAVLDATNTGRPYTEWGWAYGLLGLGGAAGLASTIWLRRRPESRRLAGGLR
ncbi:MAG TPA: MFS transporter [Methylomirabilota bacterium]|jgi:MFS family permease|nr:MFS transporter [Methylomirabilota bacterium]